MESSTTHGGSISWMVILWLSVAASLSKLVSSLTHNCGNSRSAPKPANPLIPNHWSPTTARFPVQATLAVLRRNSLSRRLLGVTEESFARGKTLIGQLDSSFGMGFSHSPLRLPSQPMSEIFGLSQLVIWPRSVSLEFPCCSLGLGPFLTSPRPISKRCFPLCSLQKPRFYLTLPLFLSSKLLCRLMEPIVYGRRLEPSHTILLCWYKTYLRTWLLESPKDIILYLRSLKKTLLVSFFNCGQMFRVRKYGIMTLSLRSGGYRSLLIPIAVYPLLSKLIFAQINIFRDRLIMLLPDKPRSDIFCYVLSRLQTLCGFLNLHGRLHVRENPPVMLRHYTLLVQTLVLASFDMLWNVLLCLKDSGLMLLNLLCETFYGGLGSLSKDHPSPCSVNVFNVFKASTSTTFSCCYGLPMLIFSTTTFVANKSKQQSTFPTPRTSTKALLYVAFLVSARIVSLTSSSTPSRLLTLAICSSFDSLLEESSINFDLTSTTKLLCFWLQALKKSLSISSIYLSNLVMLILDYGPYCYVLNFGIASLYLCSYLLH